MLKYKFIKRKKPLKPDEPAKWYASPITGEAQTIKSDE